MLIPDKCIFYLSLHCFVYNVQFSTKKGVEKKGKGTKK